MKADLVVEARARLGEGPTWDARTNELLWVDILEGRVHRYAPGAGTDRAFPVGSYVGAVVPRVAGGYALAVATGYALASDDGAVTQFVAVGHDDRVRMNDGACDPGGRFWAGSMRLDEATGGGCLYRLDPDGSVKTIADGISISNGIAWSPDEKLLYHIDTPKGCVDVFDYDVETGNVEDRRQLFVVDGPGFPDGMIADADGCLWIALWGGGAIHRYSPDGGLLEVVEVPVSRTTKAAFGGPDLTDLYITTASGPEPHAGGLFAAVPGARGLPTHAYAG